MNKNVIDTNKNVYNTAPVAEFLMQHAAGNPVSFHMPGHKGRAIYDEFGYSDFLGTIMDCDITEIPGADNLFQTEGIIKETMEHYRKLYGAKASYLLINGTSGGIIASVLASVKKGHKLVMARNCHKSVFNALTLGDIEPIYAYPDMLEEYGISGAVSPGEIAKLLDEHADADAVILPSPNYYGICSDIKAIAEEVHKRNRILIVDQAHGAHLKFFNQFADKSADKPADKSADKPADMSDNARVAVCTGSSFRMPVSAEEAGADIIINSTHKT
ncbi:MAG: hypothetical protein HUJ76_10615, partial [Parasporobacterium sp.]|nr:hypothetical protein [Parasporobacterium sp.]